MILKDEINENFHFLFVEHCNGIEFEVYLDYYDEQIVLAWISPRTGRKQSYICELCTLYKYIAPPSLLATLLVNVQLVIVALKPDQ